MLFFIVMCCVMPTLWTIAWKSSQCMLVGYTDTVKHTFTNLLSC